MALYKKKSDSFFRKDILKLEKFKTILNFLQKKISIKASIKLKFLLNKKMHNTLVSKTQITRRCVLTNRSRSVYRPYNVSRVILRDMLQNCIIPGYFKSAW